MANRNTNGRFVSTKKEEKTLSMLTLSQAVSYSGIKKPALKALLSNQRFSHIFTLDSVKVIHFHDEVPDLIEISTEALDAYKAAKEAGTLTAKGKRARTAGKPRKYTVYIPDAISDQVRAALASFDGVTVETAYKARAKKDVASVVATSAQENVSAPDLIEELIEA